MLVFESGMPPMTPGRRVSNLASRWARPAEMSSEGSSVGAASEAELSGEPELSGEADGLLEAPDDAPADVPTDAEGTVVLPETGVAVAVAPPQPATKAAARPAPSNALIMAFEVRTIDYPDRLKYRCHLGRRGCS
jgi:hypothetical protein